MKIPFFIFGLLCTVSCKSIESDYYLDDDIKGVDENYEDVSDDETLEETNVPSKAKPISINTESETFVRNLTESVVLPCAVNGKDYVRMWRKNGAVLFQSAVRMGATNNMEILKEGGLKISDLKEKDAGDYECTAMISEQNSAKVTHTLLLNTRPHIESLTAKDNVTVLKSGDTLILTCKASGYPKPVISWHTETGRLGTEGEVLTISNIKHHDQGPFRCLADNNVGNPASEAIHIEVNFKPMVTIEQISVSSENNLDTELKCIAHSDPKPQVVWIKDGINIKNSKHTKLSTNGNEHILIIKSLQEQDFGIYVCSAFNYLGKTSRNVTLVKTPAVLRFVKPQTDTKELVLAWEVQSKSPILGHELQYRKKGDSEWQLVKPEVSSGDNEIYTVKYTLKRLEPAVYETRIRSQNNNGWSEYSEIMPFEGVYAKHGHHKSHKKAHRNGKEKQLSTQEIGKPTQPATSLKSGEPAQHQENVTTKDPPVGAQESSGCSLITPTVMFVNIALIIVSQIRPPAIRI